MPTATIQRPPPVRVDVPPPPRWAERTAHLIPLLTLPSGLWRVPLALGMSMGMLQDGRPVHVTGGEAVYVLSLSVVCEALALLSFGLVRRWGEVVPAWIPVLGGRPIPRLAVVIPAMAGAVALTTIWVYATANLFVFVRPDFAGGWWTALLAGCYLPLLLWGPLLFLLAVNYHHRHRP
jgi:hypothetical protein